MTSGVPYGGAPEEAAADAEPTFEQPLSVPFGGSAGGPSAAAPAAPLAIPGIPLDRPELHVAAAFAGGFVLALVLKRLAH